jgi:integrase
MASHFTDQGNSVATVNRKLAALSKMLQVAVENHELSGLTVKPTIKKEKEVNVRLRYLNDRECIQVVELAEYFGGRDHADAVACLLDTGLRIDSELFQLQARDIDFDMGEGTVKVYGSDEKGTKGGDWRAVPMTSRVRAILKRRVEGLKPTDRVFPYPYHWMRGVWQKIREDMRMLGDKDFTPHVLRHTFCSRLAQADVSLQNIQQLAGHSDTRITLRYAKLNSRNLINSIKAIDTPTLRVVDQASGSG